MRVFVTGATGNIGSAVVDAVARAGHEVAALVRGTANVGRLGALGVRPVTGALDASDRWREAAAGFDAYVHAAFEPTPRGPELDRLAIDALGALARQAKAALIYTSGIWILGNTAQPADESAAVNPVALAAFRPAHEAQVLATRRQGVRAVVVRPGYVYGGGRGIIADMLKDADNGLMRVIGKGENHWPCVYDRDLADLYVRLLATPDASGIFHATDGADERVNEIVEAVAGQLPTRPEIRHVPMAEARRKLGPYADALALDQIVRSPRARAIGWHPSLTSVARNIPRLFEEWRNARSRKS
jgi:nucleoside-diphosphate-sugar epimerase